MRARRAFYEGLASMLGAGIPIRAALAHVAAAGRGGYGEALRHLQSEVGRGRPLADAMEERPGSFERLEVELVRAAEAVGTLDRAARSLADAEEKRARVVGKIVAGTAYPVLVLHLVPAPLNIHHLVDGRYGRFLAGWAALVVPAWVLAAAAWWAWRRARRSSAAARAVLSIPVLGGILRDLAFLRWARAFAALEDAGIGPEPCAERAAAVTGWPPLRDALAAPRERLRHGASRAEAFAGAPLPAGFYAALCQGEASGTVAASLGKAADALEVAVQTRVDALLAAAPVAATVIAGAAVAWTGLRILGGYYGGLGGL